jgi:hypothetical protein
MDGSSILIYSAIACPGPPTRQMHGNAGKPPQARSGCWLKNPAAP